MTGKPNTARAPHRQRLQHIFFHVTTITPPPHIFATSYLSTPTFSVPLDRTTPKSTSRRRRQHNTAATTPTTTTPARCILPVRRTGQQRCVQGLRPRAYADASRRPPYSKRLFHAKESPGGGPDTPKQIPACPPPGAQPRKRKKKIVWRSNQR